MPVYIRQRGSSHDCIRSSAATANDQKKITITNSLKFWDFLYIHITYAHKKDTFT